MRNVELFHRGELDLQQLTGEPLDVAMASRIIQDTIPDNALHFLSQQSIIWIGIEDDEKFLWAFPLTGSPGFISSTNTKFLEIDLNEENTIPDQWFRYFTKGKFIACLVIELSSRRRIRINGIIKEINKQKLHIEVQQAYPNCPKYIRSRVMLSNPETSTFQLVSSGTDLNEQSINIIDQSDTAFVASIGPNGADVSHRGGPTGFIKCHSPNKIIMPDYRGNNMFNSLGNLSINNSGGLTIVDFNQAYFLQLAGEVNLLFDGKHPSIETDGTNRYWEMIIHKWRLFKLESNFTWEELDFSPYNPG